VFDTLDETALLDRAIDKRLRTSSVRALDAKGRARLVRSLVSQGFEMSTVFARLRARGAEGGD
jgi:hypothetical protein